eukprot:434340-Hanusia_phi.AAC.1
MLSGDLPISVLGHVKFGCFLNVQHRLMVLNQVTLANFYKDELFWKHLCELMASESCLYCPRSSQSRTWKQMYQFLSSIQSTFVSQPQKCDRSNDMLTCGGATKTRTSFNIKVFTRVRPSSSRSTGASVFSHAAANHMVRCWRVCGEIELTREKQDSASPSAIEVDSYPAKVLEGRG